MSRSGRRKRNSIDEQFIAHPVRMLESPAYQVMSLSARRVLARVEIEHAHHGGNDNGKLPVTFDDFVRYGVHRHAIGPATRECETLGFLEVTERGYAGNAEFRTPNKFRLTYLFAGGAKPTNEWAPIESIGGRGDREEGSPSGQVHPPEKQKTSDGFCQISVPETITETRKSQCRKPSLQSWYGIRHYFLYLGWEAGTELRDLRG